MRKYLLPREGRFYKANLHCHTTNSDGKLTPEEVKELYQSMGYSVVAFTDHDVLVPHPELTDENFLALNGFEVEINEEDEERDWIHRKTCHICFVGLTPENVEQPFFNPAYLFANAKQAAELVQYDKSQPFYVRRYDPECINEMMHIARQKGFFVTYNHPVWSQEDYSDYSRYEGMHAFEIVNYGCVVEGFEEYNTQVYTDLLRKGRRIFAVASDDNHNRFPYGDRRCDSGGGFVMIKADKLEYRTITKAMEAGAFYASEGPEIKELYEEDGEVFIRCSPADRIFMSTDCRAAQAFFAENGEPLTEARFTIPQNCSYFRFTVTDASGKHASTNAYFRA